ncbi:MAG: hypothetical protein DCC67_10755, partial [Planctomycetota bacterium]
QFATALTETSSSAITVTVPDRGDADATPETIRYHWPAAAGQPLKRQLNGGPVANVLPAAHNVSFQYHPTAAAPKWVTVVIQRTANGAAAIQTSIPLVNMP